MMIAILIDWVKILNQFKVRNIQVRITFFKIVLLFGFFYLTISISIPFWDFSYLLAYICFERGLDIQLKKRIDFAMIATTPFSLLNKYKLIFVQSLFGGGLLFFILLLVKATVQYNLFFEHTLLMAIGLLTLNAVFLNLDLLAKRISIIMVLFRLLSVVPFFGLLILSIKPELEALNKNISLAYTNNLLILNIGAIIIFIAVCPISFFWFKKIVTKMPFPNMGLIERFNGR